VKLTHRPARGTLTVRYAGDARYHPRSAIKNLRRDESAGHPYP
jgi:hypothetical protein